MTTAADPWRTGGCHCGRLRFALRGPIGTVLVCNCSICTKRGTLHWIVPLADFRQDSPPEALAEYRFGTGVARHYFCPTCGCAPFYVPRSDPDKIDVNVRCLDDIDLNGLVIEGFDGRNWDAHYRDVYAPGRVVG